MVETLLVSLIMTILIGVVTIDVLKKRKIKQVERHDGPQSHLSKVGTPTMGGIMCILTTIIMLVIYSIFKLGGVSQDLPLFILLGLGSLSIAGIGFVDDFLKVEMKNTKGLKPKLKMVSLIGISAIIMYLLTFVMNQKPSVRLLFGNELELARTFKVLLGIIVITATANSVNLTDGVDGLATSVSIVIMSFLAGIALKFGVISLGLFLAIVIGAFIAFLLFNWHKAKVFMGDTGSFFLGAVIAISAIVLKLELFLLLIAIIPVFEAISVIIQVLYYKKTKKRFFKMAPIHHHFEAKGWSEIKVVFVFTAITMLACLLATFIM